MAPFFLISGLNDIRQWISGYITDDVWADFSFLALALAAAGVLVLVVKLIFVVIERFITRETETTLDDKILTLISQSIDQIIFIIAFYLSFDEIRGHFSVTTQSVLIGLSVTIFSYLVCRFLVKLFDIIMQWYVESIASKTETSVDEEFAPLVERLVKIVIYVGGVAFVLNYFQIDLTGLAIFAGAVSFAVGFASQDTLSNMIAGFVIMIDRPFRVGDRVRLVASGLVGDVIHIGLRSTKILNFENHTVIIPNAEIAKSQVINYSYPDPAARVKIDVIVASGTDLEKVKLLLETTAAAHPEIMKDPVPRCYFLEFQENGLLLTVISRVANYRDEFRVAEELRVQINEALRSAGVVVPYPQRVVHFQGKLPS